MGLSLDLDGPLRHLGNPLLLVRDLSVFTESQIVEEVGGGLCSPQSAYASQNKPMSALWLPTDPESGAAPTVNSSSRSSSPSKVMDEGKVKSAVILNCY